MILPNLSLLDRLAIWVLHHSPRVSLLVVKDKFWPDVFFAADQTDPIARSVFERSMEQEQDPLSMVFERIYHQPAHGEDE
jgi:hypothetical protein